MRIGVILYKSHWDSFLLPQVHVKPNINSSCIECIAVIPCNQLFFPTSDNKLFQQYNLQYVST